MIKVNDINTFDSKTFDYNAELSRYERQYIDTEFFTVELKNVERKSVTQCGLFNAYDKSSDDWEVFNDFGKHRFVITRGLISNDLSFNHYKTDNLNKECKIIVEPKTRGGDPAGMSIVYSAVLVDYKLWAINEQRNEVVLESLIFKDEKVIDMIGSK